MATEVELLDLQKVYGGRSLHEQSHGESFLALLNHRFFGNGLYFLDEPEAALSPTRQMSLLAIIHRLVKDQSELVIATHSPILLAYPDAKIYAFSDAGVSPIQYEDTEHFRITRDFLNRKERMLEQILSD